MRASRIIGYAVGWAVLTVLAAGVVWWGLGPLLAPIMQAGAAPTQSPPSSGEPPLSLQPSRYEGWQIVDGAFVQTFEVDGGRATVRIVDKRVELVSSRPNNGYTITPRQPSPDRLVVEFFDGTHFFVLDTMWWENKPYSKVTQVS